MITYNEQPSTKQTISSQYQTNSFNYNTDNPSLNSFQSTFKNKVRKMEQLIDIIKEHAYDKQKQNIEEKLQLKSQLENNISVLTSYINLNRMQNKNFKVFSKSINQEKERINNYSMKIMEEKEALNKELLELRSECNKMQNQIVLLNEHSKNMNAEKLKIERDIMTLQDISAKIKRFNIDYPKQKDNLQSSILLLKRHSKLTKEKIHKLDTDNDKFFGTLTFLAQKALYERNDDLNKKKNKKLMKRSASVQYYKEINI
jgi:chromosome segregation ATPase